jgi:hypothetical protein
MSNYEIFAWDGDNRYFLIMSCDEEIETIDDLSEIQEQSFPIVRQYDAAKDVLYGWDYLDSIIRMSGGGHFADQLELYDRETTAGELLETATIREPDELSKGIEIPEADRR